MKTGKRMRKVLASLLAAVILAGMGAGAGAIFVRAAGGTVYTCVIHPCYAHPVTGVIEDSGGEAAYATGQGMVEGTIYQSGILERTDSGEFYLTIRMSMMDYTSNHSFWVQNVGDSGWSGTSVGVTGNGTDSNGTTKDICMKVPSENCVVRVAMRVDPMGRDVVFYLYPSDYSSGNNTDFKATIVTATSGSGGASTNSGNTGTSPKNSSATTSQAGGTGSSLQKNSGITVAESGDDADQATGNTAPELSSSISESAKPETKDAADSQLNDSQGLSLSTAQKDQEEERSSSPFQNHIFAVGVTITVSGLILLGAVAVMIYFFRKNWKRWGGDFEDDRED